VRGRWEGSTTSTPSPQCLPCKQRGARGQAVRPSGRGDGGGTRSRRDGSLRLDPLNHLYVDQKASRLHDESPRPSSCVSDPLQGCNRMCPRTALVSLHYSLAPLFGRTSRGHQSSQIRCHMFSEDIRPACSVSTSQFRILNGPWGGQPERRCVRSKGTVRRVPVRLFKFFLALPPFFKFSTPAIVLHTCQCLFFGPYVQQSLHLT
jgi:hypothetical protein